MESFYTLQGEGYYAGQAAYFIRLGGCDVGCVWCDVKDSWDESVHPRVSIDTIINRALIGASASTETGNIVTEQFFETEKKLTDRKRIAVVTGGEPLLHNLDHLTTALHKAGFQTNIETSGSSPLSGQWDWICLSPKKFKAPRPEILPLANELKVVVFNKTDFAWAEQHAAQTNPNCKLYLQVEWSRRQQMMPLIVDYIKANPKWQISVQIHKYINVP